VLTPVHDRKLIQRLVEVVDLALQDDTNSWALGRNGEWARVSTTSSFSLQERLKESALGRARRRRDLDTRAQPLAPGA
jgi:polyphosphate kinase